MKFLCYKNVNSPNTNRPPASDYTGRKSENPSQFNRLLTTEFFHFVLTKDTRKIFKKKKETESKRCNYKKTIKFDITAVGHFLYAYALVEYHLLMSYCRFIKQVRGKSGIIRCGLLEEIAENCSTRLSVRHVSNVHWWPTVDSRPIR